MDEYGLYRKTVNVACFGAVIGAFALDMWGVRSAVVGASENPYQKEVDKMNEQLTKWKEEAKQYTDTTQKMRYQQASIHVGTVRNEFAIKSTEWNIENSFGGIPGVAGLALVTAGAACGSF